MTTKQLSAKLKELATGEPWFGASAKSILETINQPNAGLPGGNTSGQILEHMLQWKRLVVEKASGNEDFNIKLGSLEDWNKDKQYTSLEFDEMKRRYFTLNEQLISILSGKTDEWLKIIVPGGESSFGRLVDGIIDHDIAHLAQLSILKRVK